MSRFAGLPENYDPWLVLSVRERPEGGNLTLAVAPDPLLPPSAARELVVLVHGFNNHMGEAADAYLAFRDRQYPKAGLVPPALEPALGDFFWPGDADWSGVLDKADFLVYPTAVNTAPHAGQRLADYLLTLPNLILLNFVGHSLGCRVVLECIDALARANAPVIRRVVLMAAAVPAFMVESGGALARAVETAQSVVILHSTDDPVLHYAFPPGQTIAGIGEGFLPTALGRFGPPAGMVGHVEEYRVAGAGHSDYWGAQGDGASAAAESARAAAAGFIADALQLATLARSVAGARRPAAGTLVGFPRRAADARNLPLRRVGGR